MDEELRKKINKLILRYRNGDPEAERLLIKSYKKKIKFYVYYKNVWLKEIKDIENLIEEIMSKLLNWFLNHYIEKSDKSVVYNLVRRECALQGNKDKREPAYGVYNLEADSKNDFTNRSNLTIQKEILNSIDVSSHGKLDSAENKILFNVSFYSILSKCLMTLSEPQQKALDQRFFLERTYKEIGQSLDKSNVAAFNYCKSGLENLRKCLNKHGIFSTGDFL